MKDKAGENRVECSNPGSTQRWLAACGIIAPVLFAGLVAGLSLLEPGYSHRTETMSILGGVAGIRGAVFNVGLALTGLLLTGFAVGLNRGVARRKGSVVGPLLIALGGMGMIGSAVFHCSPGCVNVLQAPTLTGAVHIVTSFVTGFCLAVSPLATFPVLRRDQRWKKCR